jgi:hypothetical protein
MRLRNSIPKGRIGVKRRLENIIEFIIVKNGLLVPF